MASSYHQLGSVDQERGDYDEALKWYRKSLAILEELGNRAGMASSYGQIASLLTSTGKVEEAIPLTLECLMIFAALKAPQVGIAVRQLANQEEILGTEAFRLVVVNALGEENADQLLQQLHAAKEAAST